MPDVELGPSLEPLVALFVAQGAEGDPSWTSLSGGYADRPVPTSRTTAVADEAVPLVFGDQGLHLRQFPNLMAERCGIGAGQRGTTTSAGRRYTRDDVTTLLDRQEWPLVLGMTGLGASAPSRFGLDPWRLGVRMGG